jgi:hypothetical protein
LLFLKNTKLLLYIELNEAEDSSAPMDKVLDCFSSCVQVSLISDLLDRKEQILELISIALSSSYNWPGMVASQMSTHVYVTDTRAFVWFFLFTSQFFPIPHVTEQLLYLFFIVAMASKIWVRTKKQSITLHSD